MKNQNMPHDLSLPAVRSKEGRTQRNKKPFVVLVLDESDGSCCPLVGEAQDYATAAQAALQVRKAQHELEDLSNEEAGFRVAFTFGMDDLRWMMTRIRRRNFEFHGSAAPSRITRRST